MITLKKSIKMPKVICVFIFIFFLSLYSISIGLQLSDYAVIVFVIFSALKYKRIRFDFFVAIYFFWLFFSVLSIFFIFNESYFVASQFFLSAMRVFLGILAISFVPLHLIDKNDKNDVALAVKWFLLFCAILQIMFYIAVDLGFDQVFNIIKHGDQANRGSWLNVYDYTYYIRFGGLFEEPSWYSWFNVYLFGILTSFERHNKVRLLNGFHLFLIAIGFFLTFSIAGITSFIILCFFRVGYKKITLLSILIFLLLFFVSFFFNDSPFIARVMSVIDGSDGSANTRILGSFARAVEVISNVPMGAGFGNTVEAIRKFYFYGSFNINSTISNQNGFIEIFLSSGLFAGCIYFIPFLLMSASQKYRITIVTITLVYFTTSSIFIIPMWILLGVSFYILDGHDLCAKNKNKNK